MRDDGEWPGSLLRIGGESPVLNGGIQGHSTESSTCRYDREKHEKFSNSR